MNPKKIINWSELSRFITKGDRGGIRANSIPEKHKAKVNDLLKLIKEWSKR
jgi:hypothetical protein